MQAMNKYYSAIGESLSAIMENEQDSVKRAARLLADAIKKDQLIHVIGTGGHSSMAGEEMLWRAGGLVHISPLLEQGYNVAHGALRSNMIERLPGYAGPLLNYYQVKSGEVIIVVNAYGINSLTIDTIMEAKARGMKVIAVTSTSFAKGVPEGHPARHPSNKNVTDLDCDVIIDTHMPDTDAAVKFDGFDQKVAPTSTILNFFVLDSLVAATVETLLEDGVNPPVWMSANLPGGDEANKKYSDEFYYRVRHL